MNRRLLVIPVLALGLAAGCSTTSTNPPTDPGSASTHSSAKTVTYRITGTARTVSVTYSTGGTDTAQESNRSLPYTKTITQPDGGLSFSYISAQNEGSSGDVTCAIVVDGTVVKTNTSSGGYQICQVSSS